MSSVVSPLEAAAPVRHGTRVRVYVWDLVVRNTHWVIALSMVALIATGLYIAHPFGVPGGRPPGPHFLMGTMRAIHFYAAIAFTLAVLVRIAWLFSARIRYARWDQFIPWPRFRRRELLTTMKFYFFLRAKPPDVIGHNPLAGIAYSGVFALYLVMIGTGLAIYGTDALPGTVMHGFEFLVPWFGGLATARLIHHLVMWVLILFVTLHMYTGALTSALEENGEADSIFSGYKFVHQADVDKEIADEAAERSGGKASKPGA